MFAIRIDSKHFSWPVFSAILPKISLHLAILMLRLALNLGAKDSSQYFQSKQNNYINWCFTNRLMVSIIILIYQFIQITKIRFSITSRRVFVYILAFNVFINLLAIADLPSLYVECIKKLLLSNHSFISLL